MPSTISGFSSLSDNTQTRLMALFERGHVAQQNRSAIALGDDDIVHIGERMKKPDAANVHALRAEREIVSARVGVAVLHCVDDLGHRDAHRPQFVGIDFCLVLPRGPAKNRHVENARHLLHLAHQEPILGSLQLIQRIAGPGQFVTINLADRRLRRKLRLQVVGKINSLQTVQRFLPIGKVVAVKREVHLHIAQAKDADRSDLFELGRAIQPRSPAESSPAAPSLRQTTRGSV